MAQLGQDRISTGLSQGLPTHSKVPEDSEVFDCTTDEDTLPTEDHEVMDSSADEASERERDSRSPSLERTTSQAAAQVQILGVLGRLEERNVSVEELQQWVAAVCIADDPEALQQSEKSLDAAMKKARNLGEDLLEDLLALDKFSGLSVEDRSSRKAAIAGIDSLLETIDASKTRLAGLRKSLQIALAAALEAETQKQHEGKVRQEAKEHYHEHEDVANEEEEVSRPLERKHWKCVQGTTQTLPRYDDKEQLLAPDAVTWEHVLRPLHFQSRQERGGYAALASVPGLNTQNLEIKLSDDQSALIVEGVCQPTHRQAQHMRQQLVRELQRVASASPRRFQQLCSNLDKVATQRYVELGEGRFGKFSATLQLPADVDAQRIKASFEDGVLRITLPRKVRQEARPMTARHPFGHQRYPGVWRQPGFHW